MPPAWSPGASRIAIGGAIAVAAAAVVVGTLLFRHASTLEVRDGVLGEVDVVAVDGWSAPTGPVIVDGDERSGARSLVALDLDASVIATKELGRDRLARLSMAGDVVFLDDADRRDVLLGAEAVSAVRLDDGGFEEMWTLEPSVDDDQLIELDVVAHSPSGTTAIFGCARGSGDCWFIGVGPSGDERWRTEAKDLRPAMVSDRSHDGRPWLVPEELVAVDDPFATGERPNRPVLHLDMATGDTREVGTGARAVIGRGFTAISAMDDGGCRLVIVHGGSEDTSVPVPCDGDDAPHHSVFGRTVTFTAADELVVLDVDGDRSGTFPANDVATRTGVGTVVVAPGLQIRSADGKPIIDMGSGWKVGDAGLDTVVVHRIHRSSNPFAADTSTEVRVLDASDGSLCAHARIDGEPTRTAPERRFLALSGCTALAEIDGTAHLLGA